MFFPIKVFEVVYKNGHAVVTKKKKKKKRKSGLNRKEI